MGLQPTSPLAVGIILQDGANPFLEYLQAPRLVSLQP